MRRHIVYAVLIILIGFGACESSDRAANDKPYARTQIAKLCNTKADAASLYWLDDLFLQADTDLRGRIYAFQYDGGVAVVFQPDIFSCQACNAFDCTGSKIQITAETSETFIAAMNAFNLVYNTSTIN